jgi:integrase
MGNIRKRGKRFRAEAEALGIRKSQSFATRAAANAWMVDTERRIRAGDAFSVHGRALEDLLMRFHAEQCPKRKKGAWEQTRLLFLCQDEIAKVQLHRLTAEDWAAWQDRQLARVSGATVRRDRALISAAITHAIKVWKWLPASPLRDVRLPPDNPHRKRLLQPGELERLWFVATTDLRLTQARVIATFEYAVETGMRSGEIVAMRPSDVHLTRRFVHVPQSKNGDERDVALSARASQLLESVMAFGFDPVFGISDASRDSVFRKMRRRASIDGLHFHDSRHTACTRLARKLTPLELARHLGMRDLDTLMIYYNESAEEIAKRL